MGDVPPRQRKSSSGCSWEGSTALPLPAREHTCFLGHLIHGSPIGTFPPPPAAGAASAVAFMISACSTGNGS